MSPGFNKSSCFSEAGCAPVLVSQNSPEDLLTAQAPSSPANAVEAAKTNHAVRSLEI